MRTFHKVFSDLWGSPMQALVKCSVFAVVFGVAMSLILARSTDALTMVVYAVATGYSFSIVLMLIFTAVASGASNSARSSVSGTPLLFYGLANHQQGSIARGGRLEVGEASITFVPNRTDAKFGADRLEIPLRDVLSAEVAARTGNPLSGGLRKRLKIETSSIGSQYFVLNGKVDRCASIVNEAIESLQRG